MNLKSHILEKFGLSKGEIKVYLECLIQESTSPFKLSKSTGIPRTTVYDLLMSLSLKGLVELKQSSVYEKQQTLVKAKNPSVLRKILQNKRKELVALEADVIEVMPSLKSIFHQKNKSDIIEFYPGIEGVKNVYFDSDLYNLNLPSYSWDTLLPMDIFGQDDLNKKISRENKNRTKINFEQKELYPFNDWTKHVLTYQIGRDSNYLKNKQIRVVDSSTFHLFLRLTIKGEYILISCAEEDELWGLKIKSKALAKSLLAIYNLNWTMAIPLTREIINSWGKNEILAEQEKRKR